MLLAAGICPSVSAQAFQRMIGGQNFFNNVHESTWDNGYVILSQRTGQGVSTVILTDSAGQVLWSRDYNMPPPGRLTDVTVTPDSGFICVGVINSVTAIDRYWLHILKLDKNGNHLWGYTIPGINVHMTRVVVQENNGFLWIGMTGAIEFTPQRLLFVIKMNLTDFTYVYDYREANENEMLEDVVVMEDTRVAFCGASSYGDSMANLNPFLLTALPDGSIQNMCVFDITGYSVALSIAEKQNTLYLAGTMAGKNNYAEGFLVEVKNTGAPTAQYTRFYYGTDAVKFHGMAVDNAKRVFFSGSYEKVFGKSQALFVGMDSMKQIYWPRHLPFSDAQFGALTTLKLTRDGNLGMVGDYYYDTTRLGILTVKTNKAGISGCTYVNMSVVQQSMPIEIKKYTPPTNSIALSISSLASPLAPTTCFSRDMCHTDTVEAIMGTLPSKNCVNRPVQFTDSSLLASVWEWEFSGGNPSGFTGQQPPAVLYILPGTYGVRLIASNGMSVDTAYDTITVYATPVAFAGNDTTLCRGQTLQLNATGGSTYQWLPGHRVSNDAIGNPITTPDSSLALTVIVTDTNTCRDTVGIAITVLQRPDTVKVDTGICIGKTMLLDAGNATGYTWLWSMGTTTRTIVADTGLYTVQVSNECFTNTSVFRVQGIDCEPWYYIPNAFTPNGNEINDVFVVAGQNLLWVEMVIYNRWGETIFEQSGPQVSWDGSHKALPAPEGVYFYHITIRSNTGQKSNHSGTITLYR